MRIKLAALAPLLALLLAGPAPAQTSGDQKKPAEEKKPSQLEELLAQALRDNPDIRVAEAKMREAEAELSRTRLLVVQKVVAHQHTLETLQSAVKVAEANYTAAEAKVKAADATHKRFKGLRIDGAIDEAKVEESLAAYEQARAALETARAALQSAKADLAKAQAELPYLVGKGAKEDKQSAEARAAIQWLLANQGMGDSDATMRGLAGLALAQGHLDWKGKAQPEGTIADKLRKTLDTTVNLKVEDQPLEDVLAYLQRLADVPLVTNGLPRELRTRKLTLAVDKISLGAAFQLLEDVGGVQFAVRDYGILATDKVPAGMTRLHDFWKGDKPKAEEKSKSGGLNPPRADVDGELTAVDADLSLASFSVSRGADALSKGYPLVVYRLNDDKTGRYVGVLHVENIKDGRGVGRFREKPTIPAKVGDRLASKYLSD
jgi:hypothetical protein